MTARAHSDVALRPMLPADVPVLAAIFQASIEELTADDYDDSQREAWAAPADDEQGFGGRLHTALTLVATVRGAPVGFIALEGAEHIDMLYVYPPAARQGIGSLLLDAIEKLAAGRGAQKLTVDASDTARPFFEAKGYEARHRQTLAIADQWLGNTRMSKKLGTSR